MGMAVNSWELEGIGIVTVFPHTWWCLCVEQVDNKRYCFLMALIDTLAQVKDEIDRDLESAGVPMSSASFIVSSVLGGAWIDLVLPPLDECVVLPPSPVEDPEELGELLEY